MHILFLTDNFPPEVNAPASRTFEHARVWVKAGHRVTVITCAPNFPAGKIFAGYHNRLFQREEMEGVRVIRVWSYITANEGFLKRTLDYLSYMVSAILAGPWVRGVDIVVATSPQFFTACAGYVVGKALRKPFVFELRDLWPESIRAVSAVRSRRLLAWLEALELFLYRRAAAVVCVTHSFKDNLAGRGIDPDKIFVVTNGADLARFGPRPRDEALAAHLGFTGKFVAGYVGTHGMAHALETILEAASILKGRPGAEEIRFLLLGDGAAKRELQAKAAAMDLPSVRFIDTVPKDEVARYWSLLDASIIHLRNNALFTTVIPSKLFESMAMGVPVLLGLAGEAAAIVETEGVGLVFEPENPEALAASTMRLASDETLRQELRVHGPQAAANYDRSALAAKMLAILVNVAENHPRPAIRGRDPHR